MKLHWSPRSTFVRKVMVFAHETGLVNRLTCVRTVVAMKAPNAALLPDNPLSKIPTLVLDDGSRLYDSGVICKYSTRCTIEKSCFRQGGQRVGPRFATKRSVTAFSTSCFSGVMSASAPRRRKRCWTLSP
jgi:glutathione S-transferase